MRAPVVVLVLGACLVWLVGCENGDGTASPSDGGFADATTDAIGAADGSGPIADGAHDDGGTSPDAGTEPDEVTAPDTGTASDTEAPADVAVAPPPRTSTAFDVRGSVGQVHIFDGVPATVIEVVAEDGTVVAEDAIDPLGSRIFWDIPAGEGYTVRPQDDPDDFAGPITVWTVENSLPPDSFYEDQVLEPGFGYLTTRDGTKLSYFLTLPGPPEDGPYPTVLSYSGYSPSRPGHVISNEVAPFCGQYPILCNAPDDPSNLIAGLMGYATLGVNMRGTGCSGGAYDYFEPLQSLDGYDVVEILARQPWVRNHAVGMVGLSFPGIAQLFVAAERPPHLAAIAPQSVIADSLSSCLLPGGIYNDGFAKSWHDNVLDAARPNARGWVRDVIAAGDTVCEAHQRMHDQLRDAIEENLDYPYYTDEVALPRDPSAWVDRIDVPVFLSGQWQDEQTGPHGVALLANFTNAPDVRGVLANGPHNDGLAPEQLVEWMDFLQLFVAREVPSVPAEARALGPIFMEAAFGASMAIPQSHLADQPDYETALAAWRAQPAVRILFEAGTAEGSAPGAPLPAWEASFDAWPIPETVVDRWHFQPGGGLDLAAPPADGGSSSWTFEPEAGQREIAGDVYGIPQDWQYPPLSDGHAVAFLGAPLEADRVFAGHASADLWIRVDAAEIDLEVNLTEVRPDGRESYVQSGWLRASYRALRADATELRPIHTFRAVDSAPLVPGEWTLVRVEMMPFAHAFRAGSRIRLSVDTPGDSRARWRYRLTEFDTPPIVEVGHDAAHPSSVALPWVPGVDVPTPLPPCESLRDQPCRDYVPTANGG